MKEKAAALPALLIGFSVASLIILPLFQNCLRIVRKVSEEKISFKLNNLLNNKVLLKSFALSSEVNDLSTLKCFKEAGKMHWVEGNSSFCALYLKHYKLDNSKIEYSNASLNFDSLQNNGNDCWQIKQSLESAFVTNSGYFAGFNCNAKSINLLGEYNIKANLLISEQLKIQSAEKLTVKGFTHIKKIILSSLKEFTLFSAGEIQIDDIESSLPLNLRLISGSGMITVNKISNNIKVSAFSRRQISVPSDTVYASTGFNELQLIYLPLGFRPSD